MASKASLLGRFAFVVAVVAAALAAGVMMGLFSGSRPENLGARDGRFAPCKRTPNCVSSQADAHRDAGHYIAPIRIQGSAREARAVLESVLHSMPRVKIVADQDGYVYAEFASRTMGFVDDVEFLLDEKAGVIHVRSASRLGRSDFGVNRDRIETIRSRIAVAMK
jgi:uncharacterized protein (DUF1499 family)